MSIAINPLALQSNSITDLVTAASYINSFPRPEGFNPYAWNTTKRIALEVWKCYFAGRRFERTLNFMHPSFYKMIKSPEGISLLNEKSIRSYVG